MSFDAGRIAAYVGGLRYFSFRPAAINNAWKRVRFTRGFGSSAASRAMKSSGSKTTRVVPTVWKASLFAPNRLE